MDRLHLPKIGTTSCVSAMWTGHKLFTSSSLIEWGILGRLPLEVSPKSPKSVNDPFQESIRLMRSNVREQRPFDRLIGPQLEYFE